ncbi:MAG: sodium:alanine symporter family protein [Planctomycetes bacterium]|nr:sodium:alanine symporter family protein [Planctomycetota bacterium]
METLTALLKDVRDFIGGTPLIVALLGTGLWLTLSLRGLQFRRLGHALALAFFRRVDRSQPGDISHFQALMTALSATVGTGNIAGVAAAIAVGGPGALFWMWVTGLLGMATKYSEAVLAVKYRIVDTNGNMAGGPMYYIARGLGWRWLGVVFALFAAIAAFGIGNLVQSNQIAQSVEDAFGVPRWATAVTLMALTAMVILGGIKSIGRVTAFLVPIMIVFYTVTALVILALYVDRIPEAFALIFREAFTATAGVGGFLGATLMVTVREGVARGLFSNESGLGSSPIAAAAARTKDPTTQALVSMTQTFIDTICVCTLTGLVIVVTGVWGSGLRDAPLTQEAFATGIGSELGRSVVSIGLVLFAYSTVIGWSYYGERSVLYLAGERAIRPYRYAWVGVAGFAAVIYKVDSVWHFADIANSFMAFPNLLGLLLLTPVIVRETRTYFEARASGPDSA